MNKITKLIAAFKAARRARRIDRLRAEAAFHAEMAEMHSGQRAYYEAFADQEELAAAGLPEATESDFRLFDEASRAHG